MTSLILVVDLGTTSLRTSVVDPSGTVVAMRRAVVPECRDGEGLAWDGVALAALVLSEARRLAAEWPLAGVAISNQRTTALVWDTPTGKPLGPVLGWSDGRTRALDRGLRAEGVALIPGLAASKWRWLLDAYDTDGALMAAGRLRAGTLDTWLVWALTEGAAHVTDHVNASHSGIFDQSALDWDATLVEALGFEEPFLPFPLTNTPVGLVATALTGAPPILALIGDQQASLYGQGCDRPGAAKITFGTSAVLNVVVGATPLTNPSRAAFGNVALSLPGGALYGAEASVMAAGSAVEWLVRLRILPEAAAIDAMVNPAQRSGAVFVPALDGLGVPHWQPQARGAFFGLSGAQGPADLVRAVLDGIVANTAEVISQAETATGRRLEAISIDGGLTRSAVFRAILAASIDRPFHRAPDAEATTRGAANLARVAQGKASDTQRAAEVIMAPVGTIPANIEAWQDATAGVLGFANARKARKDTGKSI